MISRPVRVTIVSQNGIRGLALARRSSSRANEENEENSDRFVELIKLSRSEDRRWRYDNQRAIGLSQMPRSMPKHARELAEAAPWTGNESVKDANLRMLVDSYRPLRLSRSERFNNAREAVIDYQANERAGPTHQERLSGTPGGRRISKALGKSNESGLSGGGWVESVAAQQIEDAIAKGQFEGIARGPQALQSISQTEISNPSLDLTSYLLNNIIRKQGGAPPWIAKQVQVREKIASFRDNIRQSLRERLVLRLSEQYPHLSASEIVKKLSSLDVRDPEWEARYKLYHEESMADLNRAIRGYNLQAPTTACRGYLNLEGEVRRCYDGIADDFLTLAIQRHMGALAVPKLKKSEFHTSLPPMEPSDRHYGLRQLWRDLWRTKP